MQMPTARMGSSRLILLALFHAAALAQDDATRGLAAAFVAALEALTAAHEATRTALRALVLPRVALAFAEASCDRTLRDIARQAESLDGKAKGAARAALFPQGVGVVTSPRGASQIAAAAALRDRLMQQPAAAPIRDQSVAALDAAVSSLKAKLEAREAAYAAYASAFAAELGARETLVSAYGANAGAVRQLFPRDAERRELFFDRFRSERGDDPDAPTDAPTDEPPS